MLGLVAQVGTMTGSDSGSGCMGLRFTVSTKGVKTDGGGVIVQATLDVLELLRRVHGFSFSFSFMVSIEFPPPTPDPKFL